MIGSPITGAEFDRVLGGLSRHASALAAEVADVQSVVATKTSAQWAVITGKTAADHDLAASALADLATAAATISGSAFLKQTRGLSSLI